MSAVADVLTQAADLIERDGWCQRAFRGDNGEHCASDALMRASGMAPGDTGSWEQKAMFDAACQYVYPHTGGWGIPSWNDEPQRTQAEVVAALRAAAEQAS